ncbi:MAG: DUF2852 domain-containing protein [Methylocystis sp.]
MASSYGERGGHCGRMHWKPFEIAAMVLGFIVFWPIGLAILLAKVWQRQHGDQGDLFAFAREKAAGFQQTFYSQGGSGGESAPTSRWRSTGNVAFDEWREGELARLEAERRKLADAERDFAQHIEELRRARDREEFESFMRARKGGAAS